MKEEESDDEYGPDQPDEELADEVREEI